MSTSSTLIPIEVTSKPAQAVAVTAAPEQGWFTITGNDRAAGGLVTLAYRGSGPLDAALKARRDFAARGQELIVVNAVDGIQPGAELCP